MQRRVCSPATVQCPSEVSVLLMLHVCSGLEQSEWNVSLPVLLLLLRGFDVQSFWWLTMRPLTWSVPASAQLIGLSLYEVNATCALIKAKLERSKIRISNQSFRRVKWKTICCSQNNTSKAKLERKIRNPFVCRSIIINERSMMQSEKKISN
jgi:hypothetical protein